MFTLYETNTATAAMYGKCITCVNCVPTHMHITITLSEISIEHLICHYIYN